MKSRTFFLTVACLCVFAPAAQAQLLNIGPSALAVFQLAPPHSDCFGIHGPGCDAAKCESEVCTNDPSCCSSQWDGVCVSVAEDACRARVGIGDVDLSAIPFYRLNVAGDAAVQGELDMGAGGVPQKIINVADPTNPQDVATKSYVDANSGAGGALAYAHVLADGTVENDSGNITVTKIATGFYCIGVTGGTVHVAVASLDSLPNVGGSVQAGVFSASGCPSGNTDVAVITREQSQDGGVPGSDKAFYIIVN